MKQNKYPSGWNERKVGKVLRRYESQTEDEAIAEDEATSPRWQIRYLCREQRRPIQACGSGRLEPRAALSSRRSRQLATAL